MSILYIPHFIHPPPPPPPPPEDQRVEFTDGIHDLDILWESLLRTSCEYTSHTCGHMGISHGGHAACKIPQNLLVYCEISVCSLKRGLGPMQCSAVQCACERMNENETTKWELSVLVWRNIWKNCLQRGRIASASFSVYLRLWVVFHDL